MSVPLKPSRSFVLGVEFEYPRDQRELTLGATVTSLNQRRANNVVFTTIFARTLVIFPYQGSAMLRNFTVWVAMDDTRELASYRDYATIHRDGRHNLCRKSRP